MKTFTQRPPVGPSGAFLAMSPLEIYEYVQAEAHGYIDRVVCALQYVEVCVLNHPAVAPYWLLPEGTPQCYRVWPSPKRRVA